jgi:hypothetical protein
MIGIHDVDVDVRSSERKVGLGCTFPVKSQQTYHSYSLPNTVTIFIRISNKPGHCSEVSESEGRTNLAWLSVSAMYVIVCWVSPRIRSNGYTRHAKTCAYQLESSTVRGGMKWNDVLPE